MDQTEIPHPDESTTINEAEESKKATRKHIRGSSLLLAGRFISLAMNFGVQVLTVRYLTKVDYGAFAYALTLASVGSSISLFSLDKAVSRYLPIYEENDEPASVGGAIILTFVAIMGIGAALIVLAFGLQDVIRGTVIDEPLAVSLMLIVMFLAPINALDIWFQSLFAVFASAKAIFFRRYILGPGLKLAAVLVVMAASLNVHYLAVGYVIGGLLGILAYGTMFRGLINNRAIFKKIDLKNLRYPVKEIFGFSGPLMYSDLVFILRNNAIIFLIGYFGTVSGVAEFRSVVPVARLNQVVLQSFTFLYTPVAARMFARKNTDGINDLYWQTAIWIAIFSFPVFIVTFALAEPLTVMLFGEEYAASGIILALLSLGYYFNAALGFNAHTLRVYGVIKYIVIIDVIAAIATIILSLILIPAYGALGAAYTTAAILILHNLLNHSGLFFKTEIRLFDWKYMKTYLTIIVGTVALLLMQTLWDPPILVGIFIAAIVSLAILLVNRSLLNVTETFPELLKIKPLRILLKG